MINGINVDALHRMVSDVATDAAKGEVEFEVRSHWAGGTRSEARVDRWRLGGAERSRDFTIVVDEPEELLGENRAPNPQEMLMAAFNACMMVGYVAGCSIRGIVLEKVEIHTRGMLDLRGFLGLDKTVKPGYDEIEYTVMIKGDGTREQFEDVHRTVIETSPNRWNIANPIRLVSSLVVEG